jgi:hypothetical protein
LGGWIYGFRNCFLWVGHVGGDLLFHLAKNAKQETMRNPWFFTHPMFLFWVLPIWVLAICALAYEFL